MANSPIGVIEVEFRDEPFPLRLSTMSIVRFERADPSKRGFNQILAEDFQAAGEHGPSMSKFVGLFQCLMWDHRPETSEQEAAELIDGLIGQHEQVLFDAITAAFPDQEADPSGEATGATASP